MVTKRDELSWDQMRQVVDLLEKKPSPSNRLRGEFLRNGYRYELPVPEMSGLIVINRYSTGCTGVGILLGEQQKYHYLPPGKDVDRLRSRLRGIINKGYLKL